MNARILTAAACATALMLQGTPAQATGPAEYEVKAAFIHNIARFVEWPADTQHDGKSRLCILGEDPFGTALDVLQGKAIGESTWEVVQVRAGASLRRCRVLFVSSSERANLARILAGVEDRGVLTLGDTEGFAALGVMVNFYLEQNRIRFEVNHGAVQRAGLGLSSQLLKLARLVEDSGDAQ